MNLGFSEMLFIFILAMIIFGPKKLPEIGRQIGKALNEFKRASNDFKAQLETEMRQIELEEALKKEKENISQILQSPLDTVAATGLAGSLTDGNLSNDAIAAGSTALGSASIPASGWGAMDTTAPDFAANAMIHDTATAPPAVEGAALTPQNATDYTSPWDNQSDGHSSEIAVHQDLGPFEPVTSSTPAAVPPAGSNGNQHVHEAVAVSAEPTAEPSATSQEVASHTAIPAAPPTLTSDSGKGSNG